MPAPIIAGLGAAGIAAAVGKSAATVGLSAASYFIIDALMQGRAYDWACHPHHGQRD